ncbi:MAG: 2-(1,2-epoxy-1,2-dihydrophenyl)acetyl-CoA isomerase [Methyloligella sp.]|nr:MAG: 2-(1,2-epoxy-1,2-dihydrophenyl)acetyl-CoA isomerase [Methyloligella sp.]
MIMNYSNISLEFKDGIAKLSLNRPEKLNSLDLITMTELLDAVEVVQNNDITRVLLICGTGKGFCAGQDINDPAMSCKDDQAPDIGSIVNKYSNPLVMKLRNIQVPTLAAVNGIAAGAGVSIALACDIVVATKSAQFMQAFSKIGLTPDTGNTWFLAKNIGTARAIGMTYLSGKISALQAKEWGLIWDVFNDEEFSETTMELAKTLSQAPTKALVKSRELFTAAEIHTLKQQLSIELTYISEMGKSADYIEGIKAFKEKRVAKFVGY